MDNSSIASLAVLKVNWDKGHDYIDNFVPFALEAVTKSKADALTVSDVQAYIQNQFGLKIPQGAINTLLRRLASHGYVKKQAGVYVRTGMLVDTDISVALADALRQQRALFSSLMNFANKRGKANWSEDDAANALLSYLETEFLPILAAQINGHPILTAATHPTSSEIVVSEFIVEVSDKDPETFSFLETVTKGHMLATALFIPNISEVSKKFENLAVFLDTKILLRALGLEGKGQQDYCKEFLSLLYESNVSLYCFDVTVEEVRRVLTKAEYLLRNPREVNRTFLVYEHFLARGLSPSDVEIILNNLPLALQRLRIYEKERPKQTNELGLDENRLRECLKAEMPNQTDEALFHDLDCLTAIHRLRKGHISSQIEACRYLFISPTTAVAKASSVFFNEHYGQASVPLCINDHTIATLAWVKQPELDNGLQRSRLIATAFAALQPSPKLWKQYLDEVERLKGTGRISSDDYHLLRFSTVARSALVEATRGEWSAFAEGTIAEVIERAHAEIRRETEDMLQDETERRKVAEFNERVARQSVQNTREGIEQRFENASTIFGRFVSWVIYATVCVFVPLGMYKAHSLPVGDGLNGNAALLLQTSLFLAFTLAVYSQFAGGSVRQIVRKIEVRAAAWLKNQLVRKFLG